MYDLHVCNVGVACALARKALQEIGCGHLKLGKDPVTAPAGPIHCNDWGSMLQKMKDKGWKFAVKDPKKTKGPGCLSRACRLMNIYYFCVVFWIFVRVVLCILIIFCFFSAWGDEY